MTFGRVRYRLAGRSWRTLWPMRFPLAGLLPLLGACATPASSEGWTAEIAVRAGEKLGGCAAGDLIPERPGNELAIVGASGKVWVAYRDGDVWVSEVVTQTPGEMIQCAVGDLDPRRPGDELIVVGMAEGTESSGGSGAAYLVAREGGLWASHQLLRDPALLHGVCITDGRAFAVGFSKAVFAIEPQGDGFACRPIAELPGAGKTCVPTQDGIAIACNDGSLVLVRGGPETFAAETIDQRSAGRARVGTDGVRIIVADDDGTLSIVGSGERQEIYKENDKLRGAVLADLDPQAAGLEAACAGYACRLSLLEFDDGAWRAETLYESSDRFHHLIAADVDGRPGLELVAVGYAGDVVVLRRDD